MSLMLTVFNTQAWESFANLSGLPLLNDAKQATANRSALLQTAQPLSAISAMLSETPEQNFWLAVVQAEHFLSSAIEGDTKLEAAATQWEQETTALLTLHSQHRRRLKLFNLQQALAQPNAFRDSLDSAVLIHEYPPQPIETSLQLLAACQYVSQQPQLRALNARLQASSLSLCDSDILTLDVEKILQKKVTKIATIREERDLLVQQQSDMQKLLDQVISEKNAMRETLEQNEARLNAKREERDLLLKQQSDMQKLLDQVISEQNTLREVLQQSEAELQPTREERDLLLKQQSDRQKQLDQVLFERNELHELLQQRTTDLQSTSQERDLILSQLQQVQEQLEQYYLALQAEQQKSEQIAQLLQEEQQRNKHAALAHDKQHVKEITKLENELSKTKARAASAEYAGRLLQQELTEFRGSTLWRATGPVRALSSLIRKTDVGQAKLLQDCALLLTSEYFDIEWYLNTYPDIVESKINPAEHYLLYGAAEGRLPGPFFDGNWYVQHYPDVAAAGENPLLHFIKFGQQEGRSSSPKLLTNNQETED